MYTVKITPRAQKELGSLPGGVRNRVLEKMRTLADNPRPPGSIKLQGPQALHRVRVGDYRIVYEVFDDVVVVVVIRIAHRKDVYR